MSTLDVAALRARQTNAMADLMRLCRKCARIGASKVGALGFADDVEQDMALFVLDRFIDVYEEGRDVETFLIEVGRRKALAYYRKHSREIVVGERPDNFDPIAMMEDEDLEAEARALADEQEAAAAHARSVLIERMRARRSQPEESKLETPTDHPEKPIKSRRQVDSLQAELRRDRSSRPEVRELVAIRNRMGLTQAQMAIGLGMTPNAIRSIEYGVVDGAPGVVLARAREIECQHGGGFNARQPISILVRQWCQRLGLPHDDMAGLASRVGMHRATMFRWRTGRTQPPPHDVRTINAIVEALAEHE